LSSYFGFDLSTYALDGPVPDPHPDIEQKGRVKVMVDLARRENLTIRQLYKRVYGQRGHRVVIGTPGEVADALELWFRGGAADGFNIMPLTFPRGLEDVVDLLIPELQRRGLFRTEYEGKTLRENLGLPFPPNSWAVEREQKSAG
jgi:alkanesulfonate monooxygenase SsuD/methylene tetrahydromethanopterin reductase-like flavin-dependent oxidoreductase (luciferase family)